MALHLKHWDGATSRGMWDHELVIACFARALGEPFEREALKRDDQWIKFKVASGGEVVNANLILDYGVDTGTGDWSPATIGDADYLAFTFACQLWLDFPAPVEIKLHVDEGAEILRTRMEDHEGGIMEDTTEGGRRKIYFEREGLFRINTDPDIITREALAWAKVVAEDVAVAAKHIIYSE